MDYTEFYEKAAKHLPRVAKFLQEHGIPTTTARNLNIGGYHPYYDETSREIHRILI